VTPLNFQAGTDGVARPDGSYIGPSAPTAQATV
jgi:hypothetical protein